MAIAARQADLFGFEQQLPDGLMYRPDFISVDEETALLATIASLPLKEAQYRQYTARRRVTGFGSRYDYISNELVAAPPMPAFLAPLTGRVAEWLDIPQSERHADWLASRRAALRNGRRHFIGRLVPDAFSPA